MRDPALTVFRSLACQVERQRDCECLANVHEWLAGWRAVCCCWRVSSRWQRRRLCWHCDYRGHYIERKPAARQAELRSQAGIPLSLASQLSLLGSVVRQLAKPPDMHIRRLLGGGRFYKLGSHRAVVAVVVAVAVAVVLVVAVLVVSAGCRGATGKPLVDATYRRTAERRLQ